MLAMNDLEKPSFKPNSVYHRELAELERWTRQSVEEALEPSLRIVDPHQHFYDNDRGRYLLHEFLDDTNSGHRVVATVYVETGSMYRQRGADELKPVGEIEFVRGIAAMSDSGQYGEIEVAAGIVGHADLRFGDRIVPVVEAMIEAGGGRFRGVRQNATWDTGGAAWHRNPRHLLLDANFHKGLRHLVDRQLSFDAWLFYPQLVDLVPLLKRFDDATIVLNHSGGILGLPPHDGRRDEVFRSWRDQLRKLSVFPNLSVKVGGLGMIRCGWGYHLRDKPPLSEELAGTWRPYVETCIELFGPERCMLESNFPSDKQSCSYSVLWNTYKRIASVFSESEKAALFADTAIRTYRLPLPTKGNREPSE